MKVSDESVQRSPLAPLNGPNARDAEVPELNLDVLLDLNLSMSMEVGRTRIPIRSLLGIVPGSILELDRRAGDSSFAVFVERQADRAGRSGGGQREDRRAIHRRRQHDRARPGDAVSDRR